MYDAIIIGGGPAGMAAAIYLARQKLKFILLAKELGGKTLWSSDVENYLGFHLLSGVELVEKFKRHLEDYKQDFELHEGELVRGITRQAAEFAVTTDKATYETKTLLIATGQANRKLQVPGETEFYGRGVTYCATCDAPLFKDKVVHVIGGGNSAMDAALLLEKYATQITLVAVNDELKGDARMKNRCLTDPKIKFLGGSRVTRILGQKFVAGIGLMGPDGTEREEATQGVFIEVGLKPISDFIDFVEKDKLGQIIVDKRNRTSMLGVWAAGDVTDVTEKQIAIAVGEGSKAAVDMISYLQTA